MKFKNIAKIATVIAAGTVLVKTLIDDNKNKKQEELERKTKDYTGYQEEIEFQEDY